MHRRSPEDCSHIWYLQFNSLSVTISFLCRCTRAPAPLAQRWEIPMISLIDNNTFKETKYLRVSKMGQWEPRKSSPDQWKSRIQSLSVNYRISIFHFPEAGRRDYDVPISVAIHTSDLDYDIQESRHGLNNLCMHRCELTIYIFDIL